VRRRRREGDFNLGRWVSENRTAFGQGKLTSDRQRRLAKLPGWTWNVFEGNWDGYYAQLREFTDEHGHARVPRGQKQFAKWVKNQRSQYKRGEMTRDRQRRLEALRGWTWDANGKERE